MKTSSKFLKAGIASLAIATGFVALPAFGELVNISPRDPITDRHPQATGYFPQWYEDSNGLRLELCLAGSIDRPNPPNYCLTEPPDQTRAPYVDDDNPAESNFPDEAFWWTAEAGITANNGRALLVLATEAAFANEEVIDGDQMVFNRIRIRAQGLGMVNGRRYRVTHPYGQETLTATQRDRRKPAEINHNLDFGCVVTATAECNFKDVLASTGNRGRTRNPIGKPWLVWDPAVAPAAPVGYVGDPNVDHVVTGSPTNNNLFRIDEVDSSGNFVRRIAQTNLFSVSGKIYQPSPEPEPTN